MRISEPSVSYEDGLVVCRFNVETSTGSQVLWYSVQECFGEFISTSCDAALVALLIPAMEAGEDIYIDGNISARSFYNLSGPCQKLIECIIPSTRQVGVFPAAIQEEAVHESGVATGFSAGIDSYCLLADNYYSNNVVDGFKITHLLFNNVGSHGRGSDGEALFRKRYERIVPTVEHLGLPLLLVNSNLDSFYGKNLGFQQTHTQRNASVALLLQGGIGRYMYASAYSYSDVFVGPTYDMAYSDVVMLPLLSTPSFDGLSVGSHYTRVEKTLRVAEVPESYKSLDVCVNSRNMSGYANCATCWKCLRTLATLEIAGCLERYSDSFDLKAYRRARMANYAVMLGSDDPLLREVVEFAKERNYSIPIASRFAYHLRLYKLLAILKRIFGMA